MRRFALSLVFSLAGFSAEAATSRGDFRAGYDAMMRQEYDKAIALFTSAIERGDLSRPNQALAFHYRGAEYLKKNQLAEAIRDLDNALRIDPKLVTAYNDRAIAYRRQGQYGRAIDDYGQAIRLRPDWHDWYLNRGMALTYLGRNDEAIADFTKALYYSPKLVRAFLARADVYLSRGDNANAAADYRRALAADRDLLTHYPSVAGKLARAGIVASTP